MLPNSNISCLVTSCNRHDLLRATLESFFKNVDVEPQEVLIYEDSDTPMPEWLNDWEYRRRHVQWISDGSRKGQSYACARLIREAKYAYTMWLEDDWLFQERSGDFVQESKRILDANSDIILVSLRGPTGWHPLQHDPRGFKIAEPYWRGVWGGWAWNPGLRRTRELRNVVLPTLVQQIGKDGLQHEEALSKALLEKGYRIADIGRAVVVHIGGGKSRAVEKLPPLPKILIAVPTCFQFEYESHALQNEEKFHVNGANEQTQAVRDTWGQALAKFPNVDVRYFYGKPAEGFPRNPSCDEVFLDCGDGYDSLIHKTVGVCQYAVDNGYQHVFKADTDTFVYPERLLLEILENGGDYMGYTHADVCSGGPGYILSQRAARIVATQGKTPRHAYAEDCHVSLVLADAGIRPYMLPTHRPGFSAHFYFGSPTVFDPAKIFDDVVTAHAVFPDQMRAWWKYSREHQ